MGCCCENGLREAWLAGGFSLAMTDTLQYAPRPRLKFIDLARAIAILLMLEGHFVGLSLAEEFRDSSSAIYNIWNSIRGFTAPLFFTVAGMIFAYLLSGETEGLFFKRVRVRKGLKRTGELFFWGYVLQLSLKNFGSYLKLDFGNWVYAFHVLQCIGAGLLGLLGIAAIHARFSRLSLSLWYAAGLILTLSFYLWIKGAPGDAPIPEGWPQIFQNAVRGPYSVFPLAPWLAFAFLGGAMGVAVRSYKDHLETQRSCLWFFAVAALLIIVWIVSVTALPSEGIAWFTARSAQVVAFLGLLRWVEIRFGIGVPRLLCCGRMTFEIYIVHVIVLYGGLFGIGLKNWISGNLNPWQAAGGAIVFLTAFFWFAQWVDGWKRAKQS